MDCLEGLLEVDINELSNTFIELKLNEQSKKDFIKNAKFDYIGFLVRCAICVAIIVGFSIVSVISQNFLVKSILLYAVISLLVIVTNKEFIIYYPKSLFNWYKKGAFNKVYCAVVSDKLKSNTGKKHCIVLDNKYIVFTDIYSEFVDVDKGNVCFIVTDGIECHFVSNETLLKIKNKYSGIDNILQEVLNK